MSLFEGADQTPKFEDLLEKYKDQEAIAKAVAEKDRFIEQLKREAQEAREMITQRPPAEDKLQAILDRMEDLRREPVTERQPHMEPERTEVVKGLTADEVEQILVQREAKLQAKRNVEVVKQKFVEVYGNNYGQALDAVAKKNGLSPEDLDALAARSPQLVLNLMGETKTDRTFAPPASSATVDNFKPSAGPKPRSWWNELKTKDKATYLSPAMRNQQYKDAMALGEAFEDV
jgi:hypothetical protein